jgi:argininosuccinate lyase
MKLWGGRFNKSLDRDAFLVNASIKIDFRMALQDVRGNQAWVRALEKAEIIHSEEALTLLNGLEKIEQEIQLQQFIIEETDEDIHTAIERRLTEIVGPVGGKIHTGRSRNDQVATDFRLWMLDRLPELENSLIQFQNTLIERAEKDFDILMPGFTHLQPAQVILLSHWWLAYFWMFQRDRQRLSEIYEHVSCLPLGSGALAGSSAPIDRVALQKDMQFISISQNSLDAVSDRDFALEFLFSASLIELHLSKLSEAIIVFSSPAFGYFELSDEFSTGSSLMPQKKNPDLFELARGKTGTMIGLLTGLMATLKGLPSAYDKDLQEDKLPVFSAFEILVQLLPIISNAIKTLTPHPEMMARTITPDLMATDLADYLVAKGTPFREAHTIVGNLVKKAEKKKVPLDHLALSDFQEYSKDIDGSVYSTFNPLQSINKKNVLGGTAQEQVHRQLIEARHLVIHSLIPQKSNGGKFNENNMS